MFEIHLTQSKFVLCKIHNKQMTRIKSHVLLQTVNVFSICFYGSLNCLGNIYLDFDIERQSVLSWFFFKLSRLPVNCTNTFMMTLHTKLGKCKHY